MDKILKIVGLIWLVITGSLAGLIGYGLIVPSSWWSPKR